MNRYYEGSYYQGLEDLDDVDFGIYTGEREKHGLVDQVRFFYNIDIINEEINEFVKSINMFEPLLEKELKLIKKIGSDDPLYDMHFTVLDNYYNNFKKYKTSIIQNIKKLKECYRLIIKYGENIEEQKETMNRELMKRTSESLQNRALQTFMENNHSNDLNEYQKQILRNAIIEEKEKHNKSKKTKTGGKKRRNTKKLSKYK